MILGISTASFFNRLSTEAAFDVLRGFNVTTTEVFLNTFSEYEKPFAQSLLAHKQGISVHSVHCLGTQFEPQLFAENARVYADAESVFRKVCAAGQTLGAKYYTFHGPTRLKKRDNLFDYEKLGARVNQLTTVTQEYGMGLSYENVHWTYASDPVYFYGLLTHCPHLYTTLDIKQAVQAGHNPADFLDAMGNRISTVHVCDVSATGGTALPGRGIVDFADFFRKAAAHGVQAPAFIEVYARDYGDLTELKAAYDYIAALM